MITDKLSSWSVDERFKVKLTFANGSTYEVESALSDSLSDKDSIIRLNIDAEDSITAGNPIGILSPSNLSLEVFSVQDLLNPYNSSSRYSSQLRAGVRMEVFRWFEKPTGDWRPYGTFFLNSISTSKEEGSFGLTSISGKDMLDFLGNQPIPSLTAYTGFSARGLLETIFTELRKSLGFDFTWNIHEDLDVKMVQPIAKGDRVRDVLNSVAQAMMARVYVDRSNIIQVQPALKLEVSDNEVLGTIETDGIERFNVELNSNSVFNKVRLQYSKAGKTESSELAGTERTLSPGKNVIAIEVSNTIILIDSVYVECEATDEINLDVFPELSYQVSAGLVEVTIENSTANSFDARIGVTGVAAGDEQLYVEVDVPQYKDYQASTLELTSYVIQTEETANDYANAVASYLNRMEGAGSISGVMSPTLYIGEYIKIEDEDPKLSGLYLVTSYSLEYSESYIIDLSVIKIRK